MARFAYYADLSDGSILEWKDEREQVGTDLFGAPRYRDVPARVRHDNGGRMSGYHAARGWTRITRRVELKAQPSRHICDVRCINATGKTMKCECACGGRNHGRGAFLRCTPEA